jgi:hypothetical protein
MKDSDPIDRESEQPVYQKCECTAEIDWGRPSLFMETVDYLTEAYAS